MRDGVITSLERDRKRAIRAYGEQKVLTCLSEKTDYSVLCDIYAKLQLDIKNNKYVAEAKWLKEIIEKTVFTKVMEEQGYEANGNIKNV